MTTSLSNRDPIRHMCVMQGVSEHSDPVLRKWLDSKKRRNPLCRPISPHGKFALVESWELVTCKTCVKQYHRGLLKAAGFTDYDVFQAAVKHLLPAKAVV